MIYKIDIQSNQEIERNRTISKANKHDFELSTLKRAIAKILQDHHINALGNSRLKCRSLKCKCISMKEDVLYAYGQSSREFSFSATQRQIENDVSNACLAILKFLVLDGKNNRRKSLILLLEESQKFLHKERGPDEIMIEVIYPIYVELFDKRYRELKRNKNYTDVFRYDQRIADVMIFSIQ